MSVTPMAYSTANWHWKNKTVTPWARQWFERELSTIQVEGSDGAVVSVESVVEVDGDVELGRRKSKYVRALSGFCFIMHNEGASYSHEMQGAKDVADLNDLQVDHHL
jgi:activator of HSP90 ATPase